jgi:hypothetical protein
MIKARAFIAGLLLIVCACSVHSDNIGQQQREPALYRTQPEAEWRLGNVAGFKVWFASNSVTDEIRRIYVLAESESFSEQNLKTIFGGISADFPEPPALTVNMMSDRTQLRDAMNQPIITVEPPKSGTPLRKGETVERSQDKSEPGHFEARYVRSFDRDEEYFWYNPDPASSRALKITIKERPPNVYTGNLDSDLRVAAVSGHTIRLRALLAGGASPNSRDHHGCSALMSAALQGHVEIVELLVSKGADVNAVDENGWTALMAAASNGKPELVRFLLSQAADPNAQDRFGNTALLVAAQHSGLDAEKGRANSLKNVTALWEKGVDVNAVGYRGTTALLSAARAGDIEMVRTLLEKGADPNLRDVTGLSPRAAAARQRRTDIVALLTSAGARD